MEALAKIYAAINELAWGLPAMALLLGVGLYLTVRTRGMQFRRFGFAMKSTVGRALSGRTSGDKGAVSPFQAMCTALAATVGTGNIAGVAGAIAIGGPGAIFWMWVSALLGMATKYAEVFLSIRYRERNARGEWTGGPMYYIKNGLGPRFRWLAALFCVFGAAASFGIGNIAQVNTIAGAVNAAAAQLIPGAADKAALVNWLVGLSAAAVTGLVVLGGVKRIGRVAEMLVPGMSVIYIVAMLCVIIGHASALGGVLASIFAGAFTPRAVGGGLLGVSFMTVLKKGVGRGIFSNEAGLGSSPIAHAAADTDSPVRQGMFGIFEVFADTVVICTLTALGILCSGCVIPYGQDAGAELTTAAMATTFGGGAAGALLAAGITLFAFSTLMGWSLYGARCVEFLLGTRFIRVYQAVFVLVAVLGATMDLGLAWQISETLNGLMAIPNLIAVLALSGVVIRETRAYFAKSPLEKRA